MGRLTFTSVANYTFSTVHISREPGVRSLSWEDGSDRALVSHRVEATVYVFRATLDGSSDFYFCCQLQLQHRAYQLRSRSTQPELGRWQ